MSPNKALLKALERHAKEIGVDLHTDPHVGARVGVYGKNRDNQPAVRVDPMAYASAWGPGIVAHELGHAEFDKSSLGKIIQSTAARNASVVGLSIGAIIAMTSESNRAAKAAMGATAALLGSAPKLIGEATASAKGHRMLKDNGATPEQLRHARAAMAVGGGTYLAAALFGAALPVALASS